MQLFYREGRRSVVNRAGEVLYKKAEELFSVAEELQTAMENLKGTSVGRMTLGASFDWQYRLPRLLEMFKQKFPGIEVLLEIANSERIEKLVFDRSIDMGFITRASSRPELESHYLDCDDLVPICSSRHDLAKKTGIKAHKLMDEVFIVREVGSAARAITEGLLAARDLDKNISMELGSYETIKGAVLEGKGIGMVSRQSLGSDLRSGSIVTLDAPDLKGYMELYLIHHSQKKMTTTHKAFMAMIDSVYTREDTHEEVPLISRQPA
jgi:DNA-binding transcriptional LysR family regulator